MTSNRAATVIAAHRQPALPRRAILRLFAGAVLLAGAIPAARADDADTALRQPVAELQAALLAVMKAGRVTPFDQRAAVLAPVLERTFDMPSVLRLVVGPRWDTLSPGAQGQLQNAFFRYSVASWVANFDSYAGQSFRFLSGSRPLGANGRVIETELVPVSGDPHRLDFVMRKTEAGWRAVDVLADGTISRIATLRSDFRSLLTDGTGAALSASLERKATDLSHGLTA